MRDNDVSRSARTLFLLSSLSFLVLEKLITKSSSMPLELKTSPLINTLNSLLIN